MKRLRRTARNAICPSHYMGVVEMYRATGNPRYLELSKNLIDIRGMVENGTDDNQDRIPFRDQYRAMGHAVRANYLYAGVADVYAETGEQQLMKNLTSIWNDIVTRKMYVTGASALFMMVHRLMERVMSRIVFRKCIRVMDVPISCRIVLLTMKRVPISVICCSTGGC